MGGKENRQGSRPQALHEQSRNVGDLCRKQREVGEIPDQNQDRFVIPPSFDAQQTIDRQRRERIDC
jgi:hypothetical protein